MTFLIISQILNGLGLGMLYALVGVGLTLILGVLNIPNFAHGVLYALGAYLAFTISNVTGSETQEVDTIKDLLIKQIESPVRWRESVIYMIKNGVTNFIEIGPGKVLSGLVKRIDKNVNLKTINNFEDLKILA